MTDQQREASISNLGLLMTSAYGRYELTNAISYKNQADGYRLIMERLISQRSARQVLRMEQTLGLAA